MRIFALCFLLPGLVMGFFALKNLGESLQASSWTPVQAKILSSELQVNRGDDSTTYQALGKFSYQVDGANYQSEQLYFGGGSDNIGSFHQDLVRNMKTAQNRMQTLTAWVNPDNPAEAVLVKDIRWGMLAFKMLFAVLFSGVGFGLLWGIKHAKNAALEEQRLQTHYPEQPWMWRSEWQSYSIKSSNKTLLWFSVGFAVIWNLISAPILFLVPGEILDKKNYLAAIGLLFPLVGLGLAVWAIRNYHQFKKFGESELTLQDMPARLGQALRASLSIPDNLPAGTVCHVALECVHKYTTGSGDDRSSQEDILWQDEQRLKLPLSASVHGQNLPIVFKIPKNKPVSQWDDPDNEHLWRVRVNTDVPGVNFSANFEIPVFESEHSDDSEAEYEEQFFAEMLDDETHIDQGDWSRLGIAQEQTVQGTKYTFARARLMGMCFVLTLMALLFGGIGYWLLFHEGEKFIGGGFSLAGILLTWGAIHQWLYKSEFVVSYNKLDLRSGWFMLKKINLRLDDIQRLYKHSSMSSGNTKYYGIYVDTRDKKKIKLAENLVGNRDVDSLIARISEEIGLKSNQP